MTLLMPYTIFKSLSLIILSCLPFIFTLRGDFVFDDSEAIVKNKDVYSTSWTNCFFNDFWGSDIKSNLSHKSYRPLTIITFRLNYFLNGENFCAFSFKVTNLVCHAICTQLVWLTYKSIVKTPQVNKHWDISYMSALLFAVHPIHVEAVSGIVGRADLLSGITFFLAFLYYRKAVTNTSFNHIFLVTSILMSSISMLFKENGITVLGFCIAYDSAINIVFKLKRHNLFICDKKYFRRTCITLVSILFLVYGRWAIMGGTKPEFKVTDNPTAFSENFFIKVTTYNYIYFLNVLLLIWPQWLCYDWSMGCIPLIQNLADYRIILPCLMYLYIGFIIRSMCIKHNRIKMRRMIFLSACLMVIPFLPASNIFYPVGFVIAERILYISSAGYCLLVVLGLQKLIIRTKKYKIIMLFYIFLLTVYGLRCHLRSRDWQTEYQLFINGITVCPLNAKVHYNIAKVTDAKNNTEVALASYKESIRLFPDYYQAMNNLANMLKHQKKLSEAEYYLRRALKIKKDLPIAWLNLGIVLAKTKRWNEAENSYKTALQYRKNYPGCFYNLGNLYLEMNRTDEAIKSWLHTVNLNPKHELAWTNLIALLDNTDQFEKALQIIPLALAELPQSPSINFVVANVYGKIERFDEAEKHFLNAISMFGDRVQPIHYVNLGVLYHRSKKYNLAEAMYKKALLINSSFKSAIANLNTLKRIKTKS